MTFARIPEATIHPLLLAGLAVLASGAAALAHGLGPRGGQPLDWHTPQIARAVTAGFALNNLGLLAVSRSGEMRDIEGRRCFVGGIVGFDVEDGFAFDIDESVEVTLEFDREGSDGYVIAYDKNGDAAGLHSVDFAAEKGDRWVRKTITLARARFANRGDFGADFVVTAYGTMPGPEAGAAHSPTLTLCDVRLKRSYATKPAEAFGQLALSVVDENGRPTPARAGLYDQTGRMPLPTRDAMAVIKYRDLNRFVTLRPGGEPWPHKNRYAFYLDGQYGARLPVGTYRLIVAKGLEYRIHQADVTIEAERTTEVRVPLKRAFNMPAEGWYSGDVHIHHARQSALYDRMILRQAMAEDVHVANIMQMGNLSTTHFRQRRWGPGGRSMERDYTAVPGQEDPRTARRGHTLHLNITAPVRNPERYLLYNEVFEAVQRQGGISGYAHLWANDSNFGDGLGVRRGLALDVPFGLVDFLEVMQLGGGGTGSWFDFLNLGFKLTPAAGTDYPYIDNPGAVRSYVRMDGGYSADAWFEGLAAGHTFAGNGPMLSLEVNGAGMGDQIEVSAGAPIRVKGGARINPDVDLLDRLEVIVQGEVVNAVNSAEGAESLSLEYTFEAPGKHGAWVVLRALGKRQGFRASVLAVSAPVYILVDGKSFWKPAAVPAIVADLWQEMRTMLELPLEQVGEHELWDIGGRWPSEWARQRPLLEQRVREVNKLYDELLEAAAKIN